MTYQVVVGVGVMVGHPSTNHNSSCGWFVHKIMPIVVSLEPLLLFRGTVLPSVFSSQKKKKYSIVTLPQTSSSSTLHIPMNVWPYDVWVCLFFFFCQSHVEKVHEVQYSYGFMHVGVLFWQGCVRRTHAYVGWIVSTIAVGLRNEN